MKAFAVLEQKPIPCRTVSVRFKEEVAPAVSISSIHQPSANKSTFHVIPLHRARAYSQNNSHLIVSSRRKQAKDLEGSIQQNKQKEKKVQEREITPRKKPIFGDRASRGDADTISSIKSVHLNQSNQSLEEDPRYYFSGAAHRRLKGQEQPYATTCRNKASLQLFQQSLSEELYRRQSPRKKIFTEHNKSVCESEMINYFREDRSIQGHSFKKKRPIFETPRKELVLINSELQEDTKPENLKYQPQTALKESMSNRISERSERQISNSFIQKSKKSEASKPLAITSNYNLTFNNDYGSHRNPLASRIPKNSLNSNLYNIKKPSTEQNSSNKSLISLGTPKIHKLKGKSSKSNISLQSYNRSQEASFQASIPDSRISMSSYSISAISRAPIDPFIL